MTWVGVGPVVQPQVAKTRKAGHPVLGAISGLVLGLGLAILLQQFAIAPLSAATLIGLPTGLLILGLVLGLLPRGPRPQSTISVCRTCGTQLAPTNAFCTTCGTRREGA